MLLLEQEVDDYLIRHGYNFRNNCASPTRLDFTIYYSDGNRFFLEVKEKRQPTNLSRWPKVDIPDQYLFVLDDLSARKILKMSPNSGVLIRNNYTDMYCFFDVVTLWSLPRVRVNRVLSEDGIIIKGKWMIDLRNGTCRDSIDILDEVIQTYIMNQHRIFNGTACYGDFLGEVIPTGGEVRTKKHRALDYNGPR